MSSDLFFASGSSVGATNKDGRSVQQDAISATDCGARKLGGEVILARSPLTVERNYSLLLATKEIAVERGLPRMAYREKVTKLRHIRNEAQIRAILKTRQYKVPLK